MKQYVKCFVATILIFAIVFTAGSPSVVKAAQTDVDQAFEEAQDIACSRFVTAGAKSEQTGTGNAKSILVGTSAPDTAGSEKAAARVEGETAKGTTNNNSTRVAGMAFAMPENNTNSEWITNATVTITISDGNNVLHSGMETKAALFQVDGKQYDKLQSDPGTDAPGATFPAKDGYTKDKTVYGDKWIKYNNAIQDLKVTFDVTDWIKKAAADGERYAVFRLQTVIGGFYTYYEGEFAPVLTITALTETGQGMVTELREKIAEGQGKHVSFYTRETYDRLQAAIVKGQKGLAEKFTEERITSLLSGMDSALKGLTYYADITEATGFSNAQLLAETEEAGKLILQEDLTQESKQRVAKAVSKAEQILEGQEQDQAAVDTALLSLRAAVDALETNHRIKKPQDLFECIYEVTCSDTEQSIVYDGELKVDTVTAGKEAEGVQVIRYGDLDTANVLDNIPVAFQTSSDGKYFALDKSVSAGTAVAVGADITEDRTQQFVLQRSSSWKEDYPAYKIYHPLSRMFIGYSASEPHVLSVYGSTAPDYDFVFMKKEFSVLGKVRTVPGYALLTEHEQERVIDLLGGIGAYSLYLYGGTGNTQLSFGYRGVQKLQAMYENLDEITAKEQAETIRAIMKETAFSGQTNWYGLPVLPGASGVKLEIKDETYGEYDFWRGTMLNGTRYTLVITDAYASQTVNFHVEDQGTAIANGKNAMEALKQIPYPLRRNIRNMYIRYDGANSYNCGANVFYMRISRVASVDEIAMYMTHEFGHSMDQVYGMNSSGAWGTARSKDLAEVSVYGSSNDTEDLADFGRLYFQCYGKINMMYALRQMFPNRYKAYVDTLLKTGYTDILMEKIEQIEQGAWKGSLKALLAEAEKRAGKENVYTQETFQALKQAVEQARAAIDSPDAGQDEVDSAYVLLESAIYGLEIAEEKGKIAYFSFDAQETGFSYKNSKAECRGSAVLATDAKSGKALKLDGTGSNYLTVKKKDNTPLLSDYDELTISFWSKVSNESANWAFYGAVDDKEPVYEKEVYLGILDKGTSLTVERYKNTGIRPNSPTVNVSKAAWKSVTVVIRKDKTSIFINGKKAGEENSSTLLSDILGDDSILYIGKANWGSGEYFNGLLDEFSIYNYPMTDNQVEEFYKTGKEPTSQEAAAAKTDQEKADQVIALIHKIGKVYYAQSVKERIDTARAAYGALSESQKLLVGKEAEILTSAEDAYTAAKIEFEGIQRKRIAYFSFDDVENGFQSEYAKAVNKGTPVLTEDAKEGKALSLDGKNSNYLTVTSKDGNPLLTGYDEITVCYWGKIPQASAGNWSFYAAGDNQSVQVNYEKYAAVIDKGGSIEIERYKNEGQRPDSVVGSSAADEWRFITVVISRDKTTLYINGEKKVEASSSYLLSDILQDNSICYIGRANWGTGEYFKGLIDEYSIYNYALTEAEIAKVYAGLNPENSKYTVTLDANGGEVTPASKEVEKEKKIGTLPTPTKTDCTFQGWYTSKEGGETVTEETVVNGSMTIYAHWQTTGGNTEPENPVKYTVTLDANGGEVTPASKEVEKGKQIGTLPTPTKTDCTFLGWYTAKESGEAVTEETVVNGNMTIYAHWQTTGGNTEPEDPVKYTVTLDANGGEVTPASKEVEKEKKIGTLPTPTKTDCTFQGWYTSKEGGETVTEETVVNGSMTIYAHWQAVQQPDKPTDQQLSDMNDKIAEAKTLLDNLDGTEKEKLQSAITDAENVLKKDDLTKAELETALGKLEAAVEAAEEVIEASEPVQEQLGNKIKDAKELLDTLSDAGKAKLQPVIDEAEAVLKKDWATEKEIQDALDKLEAAIEEAEKPDDQPEDEAPKAGETFTASTGLEYKVIACSSKSKDVMVTGASKEFTTLTVPDTVKYKNVTFKVTSIGNSAFTGQTTLKSAVIGKYVTSIGMKAFYNDNELAKITFKGTAVKTIGKDAFKGIKKNAALSMKKTFTSKNVKYKITKCTASAKQVTVTGTSKKKLTSLAIPATIKYNGMTFKVTAVNKKAFRNQKQIKSVTVGKNVKSIGASAFEGDKKLAKIKFSGTAIKTIGKNAFKGIKKNAVFSVKKSKKASYKKLLNKAKTKNFKVK